MTTRRELLDRIQSIRYRIEAASVDETHAPGELWRDYCDLSACIRKATRSDDPLRSTVYDLSKLFSDRQRDIIRDFLRTEDATQESIDAMRDRYSDRECTFFWQEHFVEVEWQLKKPKPAEVGE